MANIGIGLKTKLHLLGCLVLPIALYGRETWTLNKAELKKLQAFGMKCLRMVFRHHLAGAYYKCRDFLPHIQVHRIFRCHCATEATCLARARIAHGRKQVTKNKYSRKESVDTRYRGRPRKNWVDATLEGTGVDYKTAISTRQPGT